MKKLEGKRILIFQQRGWALRIGHYLARRFREEGAIIGALTFKKSTDKFVREQQEVVYEYLQSHDDIMENPEKYLNDDEITLHEICEDYGIDSIWPLVQSLRNHVKSYQDKYYYGFKQNVSDEKIICYLQAAHKMCKKIFEEFSPDVIIAPNFVAYPHIALNLYARKRGVRMIGVTDSKVFGMSIFTESYLDDQGAFIDRVIDLNKGIAHSQNELKSMEYIEENRKRLSQLDVNRLFEEKTDIWNLKNRFRSILHGSKNVLRLVRNILRTINRTNYVSGLGNTIDAKNVKMVWRDYWVPKKHTRDAKIFPYENLDKIENYAFMTLQFQPESSIDVISSRFNNQIETARQIAMSLPDDMTLVVKDHPAMLGYRSGSYLEKIARTPNVKLVDYRISTQDILKRCKIVVAATGTVFFEAAVMRVPCVQLGDLGTIRLLPNVYHYADLSTLSGKIKEIITANIDVEVHDQKLKNYVMGAYDVGFDLNWMGIWDRGEDGDLEPIYVCFQNYICDLFQN
jgi:hypothetical protein